MTKVQQCLADNMRLYRKLAHLTQEQLAERVETSTNYIGTIETGKKFPSPQMIDRIASALNIDPLQLFQTDTVFQIKSVSDFESFKSYILTNMEKTLNNAIKKL